jgi:hypothetical protein
MQISQKLEEGDIEAAIRIGFVSEFKWIDRFS